MSERGVSDPLRSMPERVGRYELLLPIASGGMATVYLARSQGVGGFEREVALKLIHPHLRERQEFAVGLIDEARIAARIRHPNVLSVLDVGEDPVGVYLVMDYVEGDSLSGLVKRAAKHAGRVPLPIGMRILCDALLGLSAAHQLRGPDGERLDVVHRDFSPQNVLVGVDGISRLTDFGIAKASRRLGETASGLIKGKLRYMSPEQARGKDVDQRTDVWAAGVVAWELVTGRRLLTSGNQVDELLKLIQSIPPRASSLATGVPPDLDDAIAAALVPEIAGRCATAELFATRLRDACRPAGLLADHSEVAAFVVAEVGKKLEERNARVREVVALRARMGELARTSEVSNPSYSSEPTGESNTANVALDATTVDDSQVLVKTTVVRAAGPDTSATSQAEPRSNAPVERRRWVPVAAALAVACAVAAALAAGRARPPDAGDTRPNGAPAGMDGAPSTEGVATAAPASSAVAPSSAAGEEPSPSARASASPTVPTASVRPAARGGGPAAKGQASGAPTKDGGGASSKGSASTATPAVPKSPYK